MEPKNRTPTLDPDEITGLYETVASKVHGSDGCDLDSYRRALEASKPDLRQRFRTWYIDNLLWTVPTTLLGPVVMLLLFHETLWH